VETVPQFRCDKDIFTLDSAFSEDFFKSLTNFSFVVVDPGLIDVTVSKVEGVLYGLVDLTFLREPSSQSDLRHKITSALQLDARVIDFSQSLLGYLSNGSFCLNGFSDHLLFRSNLLG